jgi:lysylphosphatidylglycerol synthetase-like protein (DUF2156 family)
MSPGPISTAYYVSPSLQSVCLYVYRLVFVRQRLDINVTATTNTHATIENIFGWVICYAVYVVSDLLSSIASPLTIPLMLTGKGRENCKLVY